MSTTAEAGSAPVQHVTESVSDRKKNRELAEARQSGAVAPEVDVRTGSMINPHNPEFITKRPWYLGGSDAGPSLDHQADQRAESDRVELSVSSADILVREQREKVKRQRKEGQLELGMWVEALKRNKKPYLICQITKISKNGTEFDLKFEDGFTERGVRFRRSDLTKTRPRIRLTRTGNRTLDVDHSKFGKETYDSKRDSYHGYDVGADHMAKLEDHHSRRESIRRQLRNADLANDASDKQSEKDKQGGDSGPEDDEFVQKDEDAKTFTSRLARQGGVGGAQMKVTARNLRIREDTAKYLHNLDVNSAYYDPKSRSMRDNPNPNSTPDEVSYAGDNFARISGDAVSLAETQVFAWEANKRQVGELHPQANPSQVELLKKTFKTKSTQLKEERKKAVLDKYGGAEYLDGSDGLGAAKTEGDNDERRKDANEQDERRVRFGESSTQEEYTRDGRLVKASKVPFRGVPQASKYEEDVFINGHSTVWGSYFHRGAFRWGYADDHSLMRNSYCTGANGRKANDDANERQYGKADGSGPAAKDVQRVDDRPMLPLKKDRKDIPSAELQRPTQSSLYGEAESNPSSLDADRVLNALKKLDDQEKKGSVDDRKRKFNSLANDAEVDEEDMEAYRMRRERPDDPMAKLANADEVLEYKK